MVAAAIRGRWNATNAYSSTVGGGAGGSMRSRTLKEDIAEFRRQKNQEFIDEIWEYARVTGSFEVSDDGKTWRKVDNIPVRQLHLLPWRDRIRLQQRWLSVSMPGSVDGKPFRVVIRSPLRKGWGRMPFVVRVIGRACVR